MMIVPLIIVTVLFLVWLVGFIVFLACGSPVHDEF
jgi:hypothetical protein